MTEAIDVPVFQTNLATVMERRQAIMDFEALMAKVPGAEFGNTPSAPLEHYFADGIYVRKILLPKGSVCTGRIHRREHPAIVVTGDISVYTEQLGAERYKAPYFMISPAMVKRICYAHEDTIWVTIHRNPNNLRNIEELENEIIAPSYSDVDERNVIWPL